MQIIRKDYNGLSLLMRLNWDTVFTAGTIVVGLLAGAFLGTTLVDH